MLWLVLVVVALEEHVLKLAVSQPLLPLLLLFERSVPLNDVQRLGWPGDQRYLLAWCSSHKDTHPIHCISWTMASRLSSTPRRISLHCPAVMFLWLGMVNDN